MATHKDKTFSGRLNVDGVAFESCTFKDAVLVYSGGDLPSSVKCTFEGYEFAFMDAAGNTVNFLRLFAKPESGFRHLIEDLFALQPTNPD